MPQPIDKIITFNVRYFHQKLKSMADTKRVNNNNTIVSSEVLEQISLSLRNINGWGSIEIFIQNYKVTQVIEKNIKKPSINILAEREVLIQE